MNPSHPPDVLARERDHEIGAVELVERRLAASVHRHFEPEPDDRVPRPPAHRHALDDMGSAGGHSSPGTCSSRSTPPSPTARRSRYTDSPRAVRPSRANLPCPAVRTRSSAHSFPRSRSEQNCVRAGTHVNAQGEHGRGTRGRMHGAARLVRRCNRRGTRNGPSDVLGRAFFLEQGLPSVDWRCRHADDRRGGMGRHLSDAWRARPAIWLLPTLVTVASGVVYLRTSRRTII